MDPNGCYPNNGYMNCDLKVDTHSSGWHKSFTKLIKRIKGVSYSIDAMHGVAHISGETNPNKLLTDVKKAGKHVQIIRANCRTKYNSNPGNGNTSDEIHGYGNGYEGSYHGKKEMDSYGYGYGYGYGSSSYDYNQAPSQPRLTYPKPHSHRKQLTLYEPRTERVHPPLRQGSPQLLSLEYGDPHHDPNYYSSRAIVPRYP